MREYSKVYFLIFSFSSFNPFSTFPLDIFIPSSFSPPSIPSHLPTLSSSHLPFSFYSLLFLFLFLFSSFFFLSLPPISLRSLSSSLFFLFLVSLSLSLPSLSSSFLQYLEKKFLSRGNGVRQNSEEMHLHVWNSILKGDLRSCTRMFITSAIDPNITFEMAHGLPPCSPSPPPPLGPFFSEPKASTIPNLTANSRTKSQNLNEINSRNLDRGNEKNKHGYDAEDNNVHYVNDDGNNGVVFDEEGRSHFHGGYGDEEEEDEDESDEEEMNLKMDDSELMMWLDEERHDLRGCCLLHVACGKGDLGGIEMLIQYGANVNERDGRGRTPLHHCVLFNQIYCAKMLLSRGASFDIEDHSKRTPLDLAILLGDVIDKQLIHIFSPL